MSAPLQSAPHHDDLERLLEQSGWVRALARRLTADPHAADDLVQETWIAALEHPRDERSTAPLRSWLATVLRNVARQGRRGSERRTVREALAARREAQPSAHDVVAGLALQQELARAVQALDEPYRSTLYQRFYEGLPPREIAKRAGVPVKTVKTRLERGLAALRARLDREHGDRGAWLSMLVPWLGRDHAAFVVLGGVLVQLKLALFLGAAIVCAVAVLFARFELDKGAPRAAEPTSKPLASELSSDAPATAVMATDAAIAERETVEVGASRPIEPSALPAAASLHGRVIDVHGAPVAGVDVVLGTSHGRSAFKAGDVSAPRDPIARTDEHGSFTAPPQAGTSDLVVADREWTTVLKAYVYAASVTQKPTIVVARRNPLGGLVLDRDRKPVEGADIALEPDEALRRELGEILDSALQMRWTARTDGQGHFEIVDAPGIRGAIAVSTPVHRTLREPIPEHSTRDLVLVLDPLEKPHVVVTGTVVDPGSAPVEGAWVVIGNRSTQTDARGRFELDVTARAKGGRAVQNADGVWVVQDDRSEVRAVKPGYLPAVQALAPLAELERQHEPVLLRLGPPPPSIRGVVEDEDGVTVPNVEIDIANETNFGELPGASSDVTWRLSYEEMLRGGLRARDVLTDDHGRFELAGLLEKTYDLRLLDKRTLRHAERSGVAAGTSDLVVRLPREASLKRVAGRIVGKSGAPLAGITIHPVYFVPGRTQQLAEPATSDGEGRFEFPKLFAENLGFQVTGEDVFLVFWRPIEAGEDLEHLEVVLSRRCFVQIDLSDRPDFADRGVPSNAKGARTQIMEFMDAAVAFPDKIGLVGGKSEVVAVEEDTTTIVFYKGEQEVARKAVHVVPREKVVVRP